MTAHVPAEVQTLAERVRRQGYALTPGEWALLDRWGLAPRTLDAWGSAPREDNPEGVI